MSFCLLCYFAKWQKYVFRPKGSNFALARLARVYPRASKKSPKSPICAKAASDFWTFLFWGEPQSPFSAQAVKQLIPLGQCSLFKKDTKVFKTKCQVATLSFFKNHLTLDGCLGKCILWRFVHLANFLMWKHLLFKKSVFRIGELFQIGDGHMIIIC